MKLRRRRLFSETHLCIDGPIANMDLKIRGRLTSRERRTIALTFFRHIRPWLEYFRSVRIHPAEQVAFDFDREEKRGINLFEGRSVLTLAGNVDEQGDFGFKIRMRRLELGRSQKELASEVGLSASHLSELERGLARPHRSTVFALSQVLGIQLSHPKAFAKSPPTQKIFFRENPWQVLSMEGGEFDARSG